MSDYYPPGVTGDEPQIAGEPEPDTCVECGELADGAVEGTPYCWHHKPHARNAQSKEAIIAFLRHACLAALGFLGGVSILSKEQLQKTLVEAVKASGSDAKWSSDEHAG